MKFRSKRKIGVISRSADRHKEKVDRHTNSDYGHRCICGYSKCNMVRDGFVGSDHAFDRRPILFRIPKESKQWDEFFGSLRRNLHVHPADDDMLVALKIGQRFSVAAHHFTEQVVRQYWSNKSVKKCWAVRFDRESAGNILHLPLDERDRDDDGKFFINANNPIVDAAQLAVSLHSARADRTSSRDSDESERESLHASVLHEKNKSLRAKEDRIKQLKQLVSELRNENRVLKQSAKRKAERAESVCSDNKSLRQQLELSCSFQEVEDIVKDLGGMSRATLFDKSFHIKHPGAAKCLWGFESFDETLTMVKCLFPDVDTDHVPTLAPPSKRRRMSAKNDAKLQVGHSLTALEKCLVCKMFFRRTENEELISLIFNNHRTTIGKVLKEWAPRWGKAGEQLSILDVTEEYLEGEAPERSKLVGVMKAVTVDGADTKVEKDRKDSTAAVLQYGSKNKERGARSLNWATATCLSFEHTKLFCARASEKSLYELHGSLGKRKAPVEEWKGVASALPSAKDRICKLKLATEDMFDYHDLEQQLDTLQSLDLEEGFSEAAVDDGVLLTASVSDVEQMSGVKHRHKSMDLGVNKKQAMREPRVPKMEDIDDWCDMREATKVVEKESDKLSPLISVKTLDETNKRAIEGGVNSSGKEKLAQLEVHERLHRAYEGGSLKKTILAYFLKATADDRHKLLKWLGSEIAPEGVAMPEIQELPDIWLRLAKIPPGYAVLGDKGFHQFHRLNPHFNHVRTPWKLSNNEVQDYRRSDTMIKGDRATSDTRVVVEDDYERYRNEGLLKGCVPFWVIAFLPYAHEWGHANMNLLDPVRLPGNNGNIDDTYWDA